MAAPTIPEPTRVPVIMPPEMVALLDAARLQHPARLSRSAFIRAAIAAYTGRNSTEEPAGHVRAKKGQSK